MSRMIGTLTRILVVGGMALLFAGRAHALGCSIIDSPPCCLGDCNGNLTVTAGELTKIICIILNCGANAAGCPACGSSGCVNADKSGDGHISAGELTNIYFDILDPVHYPNGCAPTPTAGVTSPSPTNPPTNTPTNTPVTPATATNTPVTPTNPPTNTPVTPATATNTPLPTATNTLPPPSATRSPSVTNTAAASTPTPSITPGGVARLCGNGVIDASAGEECDDGGTCIGGDNAGTHCTAESNCLGQGVCDAGFNVDYVCDSDADCLSGHCVHCRTFGGDGCAANCTFETTVTGNLVPAPPGGKAGTSYSLIHTNKSVPSILVLPMTGSQTFIFGKQRNGVIPGVIKADSVHFGAINILNSTCACVRGEPGMTCGGYIFEKDGSMAIDCTPVWVEGTCSVTTTQTCVLNADCPGGQTCVVHACDGHKPCALVHGAGNSGSGAVSCVGGMDATNVFAYQDAGQTPAPATPGTPGPASSPEVIRLGNACSCAADADCGAGHTCNVATGKCNCNSSAQCPLFEACNVTTPPPTTGPTTPTPTPGACLQSCRQSSDCPLTQSCQAGGPGSALFVNSTGIGQVVGKCVIPAPVGHTDCSSTLYGADCTWCTDDDAQGPIARGVAQTLPVVTGFAEGLILNSYFAASHTAGTIGAYVVLGGPLTCSNLTAPTPSVSGLGLVGAFTGLNQPTIGDSVINSLQFMQ